jgi:hypothetical protein
MSRRARVLAWVIGGGAGLLLVGVVIARVAVVQWLEGDGFRNMVAQEIGQKLNARAEIAPFRYAAGTISNSAIAARGESEAPFSSLEIERLNAELSFARVLSGVWEVKRLEAEAGVLDLTPPVSRLAPRPSHARPGSGASFWPKTRVEVQAVSIRKTQLKWLGGRVRDFALDGEHQRDEWLLQGTGGMLEHGGWPPLSVQNFRLRQRSDRLVVEKAELHQGASGTIALDGEVRFNQGLELNAKLDRLPLEPLLAPDWKKRLSGNLNGTVRIASPLPADGAPELAGTLSLTQGRLEALPVLNELAVFTQLAQFRTLTLSKVEGDFQRKGERLQVSRLTAESAGLMRVEGGFVVEAGMIKGDFMIGLTPASVQWLPGARTKLFSTTRVGYCWAPMHLEGPVDSPREDLSQRLLAAVAEGTIDAVRKVGESLPIPVVPDAAKKVLDFFIGK